MYGSIPRNDSNCVPENGQVFLGFVVYHPRDTFTDLTVRWFRSVDVTRATLSTEIIATNIPGEYMFGRFSSHASSAIDTNCSYGSLYKDAFALIIHNFTTDKDGYYWCQIVINDSYLQPSQYAWFYAADGSSCTQEYDFITAPDNKIQCAENYADIDTIATTNSFELATTIALSTTYSANTLATMSVPTVITAVLGVTELFTFVVGVFSVILLLLGALVLILILLRVHKRQRKKKNQNCGESMAN